MTTLIRNNPSIIEAFLDNLSDYESSLDHNNLNPITIEKPARYLQMAMNRLISASPIDSYQMLRCLVEKLILNIPAYSDIVVHLVASGSINSLFQDEINAIIFPVKDVFSGKPFVYTDSWYDRINSNAGIRSFLENFTTSDQHDILSTYHGNLVRTEPIGDLCGPHFYTEELIFQIPIGGSDQSVSLTHYEKQVLQLKKADNASMAAAYRDDLPLTLAGFVIVQPDIRRFLVDRSISFTPGAAYLLDALQCTPTPYVRGIPTEIMVPAPFFRCKLDVISKDSGQTWVVGNIQILPPKVQ